MRAGAERGTESWLEEPEAEVRNRGTGALAARGRLIRACRSRSQRYGVVAIPINAMLFNSNGSALNHIPLCIFIRTRRTAHTVHHPLRFHQDKENGNGSTKNVPTEDEAGSTKTDEDDNGSTKKDEDESGSTKEDENSGSNAPAKKNVEAASSPKKPKKSFWKEMSGSLFGGGGDDKSSFPQFSELFPRKRGARFSDDVRPPFSAFTEMKLPGGLDMLAGMVTGNKGFGHAAKEGVEAAGTADLIMTMLGPLGKCPDVEQDYSSSGCFLARMKRSAGVMLAISIFVDGIQNLGAIMSFLGPAGFALASAKDLVSAPITGGMLISRPPRSLREQSPRHREPMLLYGSAIDICKGTVYDMFCVCWGKFFDYPRVTRISTRTVLHIYRRD